MGKKIAGLISILLISLLPVFFIWVPFFFQLESFWGIPIARGGMATIISNYDGPLYLVVAKTMYNLTQIKELFSFPLPAQYYAAHFPLFPFLIRALSPLTGLPYAMLTITLTASTIALYFFNKLAKEFLKDSDALWLTAVFSILPARWLIVRSVGSPEPLFLAGIIASIYYFRNKKYLLAGIWGMVAQLTKSPAILLFLAYIAAIYLPKFKRVAADSLTKITKVFSIKRIYPIFLIPISLIAVFTLYSFIFNDFFAYFNSGDNIHLLFPPFQIFNYSAPWVGTFWL